MVIPGFIISMLTFPGVIMHEFIHQLFCRIAGVAVLEVCYFRLSNPAGYIIHESPRNAKQCILIGFGPFIVSTLMGVIIAMPSVIPVIKLSAGTAFDFFLIWLGVSIAMHSFPSIQDAKKLWEAVSGGTNRLKFISVPTAALIYAGAYGAAVWLDLIYGIGVAIFLPTILVALLS